MVRSKINKWQLVDWLLKGKSRQWIGNFVNSSGVAGKVQTSDLKSKYSVQYELLEIKVVTIWDKNYPELLRQIADPPVCLFYKGRLPDRDETFLAVVGSRAMSRRGRIGLTKLIPGLVKVGAGIVSGLAVGVDGEAHRVCLNYSGRAVAVLPVPLDRVYPSFNQKLAEEIILADGCLISEYPLGVKVERKNFLERNRIVSGLSLGVIVVEAGERSGSVATAGMALDQGREVWCLRTKNGEVNSEGILRLVEDGAKMVSESGEILGDW